MECGMETVQIFAGNDLRSGRVVYLQPDGQWSCDYHSATRLISAADLETAENSGRTAVSDNRLVDPYPVEVVAKGDALPVHQRERIRYSGPTCFSSLSGRG